MEYLELVLAVVSILALVLVPVLVLILAPAPSSLGVGSSTELQTSPCSWCNAQCTFLISTKQRAKAAS